jgi:hypothetical protein
MRYFFDVDDDKEGVRDEIGVECSRDELRAQAIAVLPDLVRDTLPDGDRRIFKVRVRDEDGHYVFEASLEFEARWLS